MLIAGNIKTNHLFLLLQESESGGRGRQEGKTPVLGQGDSRVGGRGAGLRRLTGMKVASRLPRSGEGGGLCGRRGEEGRCAPWEAGRRGRWLCAFQQSKCSWMSREEGVMGSSWGRRQASESRGCQKSQQGQQGAPESFPWGMARYPSRAVYFLL